MVEIFNLFKIILLIPLPMPFNFNGTILYYNLFGLIICLFCIFCISFIIHRLFIGDGGVGN